MLLAIYVGAMLKHHRMVGVAPLVFLSLDDFDYLSLRAIRVVGNVGEIPVGEPSSNVVNLGESLPPLLFAHLQSGSSTMRRRSPSRCATCGARNVILMTLNGPSSGITPASTSPSIAALTAG